MAALEARLKEKSTANSKAGTLRALGVVRTAHQVAAGALVNRRCALDLEAAGAEESTYTYTTTLTVERRDTAGVKARWAETRTLRRATDGDLALSMDAGFRTELGIERRRRLEWRFVGPDSFVSDDGRAFYRQGLAEPERGRLVRTAQVTVQTLLDAVSSGWSPTPADEASAAWKVGGERLVCVPQRTSQTRSTLEAGWLRRFATRAVPLDGRFFVDESGARTFAARWQLEDGSTLHARFTDELSESAEEVEAPAEANVVEVERDRSLHDVERLLGEMARAGLIGASPGAFDRAD